MADKTESARSEAAKSGEGVQRFIKELRSEPLSGHVVHGMIKPADTDDGLMLAHLGDCEQWVYVPATVIQTIERTGRVSCGAHAHATARIELKEPQSDLERALADVAGLHQAKLFKAKSVVGASPCPQPCPPGTSCKQDQFHNWGCFP